MNIMSWIFLLLTVVAVNIYEITVVTFLLKMSSKKERLSRKITRERSLNRKRMQWRMSAHVLPRLFSICSSSIDFTWLSTCSRHVRLPFRTHLAIVAGYSNINTHGCIYVRFWKKCMAKYIAVWTGLSYCRSSFKRKIF